MTERIETIKDFAQVGFDRLERCTKDLKPYQLDWKYCPEANTIRWILTHLSDELHVYFHKILTGNKDFAPKGWPKDYVGNTSYSLEKILSDIEDGKKKLMKSLSEISPKTLAKEMDWFYGKKPREFYLMRAVSEIIHHEGQIAAILGVEKRIKGEK